MISTSQQAEPNATTNFYHLMISRETRRERRMVEVRASLSQELREEARRAGRLGPPRRPEAGTTRGG